MHGRGAVVKSAARIKRTAVAVEAEIGGGTLRRQTLPSGQIFVRFGVFMLFPIL